MESTENEDNTHTSNIGADELDQETSTKLRGDAIGNTMYSEVFVINTLLKFSELNWNNELENSLCFLWDMTEENDVCQFLFKMSYPNLACSAIQKYNEPRFIEIVVGVFANLICCTGEKNITVDEITTVLSLLSSDDPYILIQVMRFLHGISYLFKKLEFIEEWHLEKIDFILSNSTNKELLSHALKSLASITEDSKIKTGLLKQNLIDSVVIAFRTFRNSDAEEGANNFDSQEVHTNIKYMISFMCNMCSYVQNSSSILLTEFISEIVLLLDCYKSPTVLSPVEQDFKFYIEAITYVFTQLHVHYNSSLAKRIYDISLHLYQSDLNHLDLVLEILCYLIFVGNMDHFKSDFENVNVIEVKKLLHYIANKEISFEFDYGVNLKDILNQL